MKTKASMVPFIGGIGLVALAVAGQASAQEQVVKQAIFALARDEMERQDGERLQPALRVVRDSDVQE